MSFETSETPRRIDRRRMRRPSEVGKAAGTASPQDARDTPAASHLFPNAPCSDIPRIQQQCSGGQAPARRAMASAGAAQPGQQRRWRRSRPQPQQTSQGQYRLAGKAPSPPFRQFPVCRRPPSPPLRRCRFPARGRRRWRPSGHRNSRLRVLSTHGRLRRLLLPARQHPHNTLPPMPPLAAGAVAAVPFCRVVAPLCPSIRAQRCSPQHSLQHRPQHGRHVLPLLPIQQRCTRLPGLLLHTCKQHQSQTPPPLPRQPRRQSSR